MLLYFCTYLVQNCTIGIISHIELIPLLHVVEIACREAFDPRILRTQIETQLIDYTSAPTGLCFLLHNITSQQPVELQSTIVCLQSNSAADMLVSTLYLL